MEYRLESWKLRVDGEYPSEEKALEDLSDKYMACSKCDPPGEHPLELLSNSSGRSADDIAKRVFFSVKEKIYGHEQWVQKYILNIYPFKVNHWWPTVKSEELDFGIDEFKTNWKEKPFRYEIVEPESLETK